MPKGHKKKNNKGVGIDFKKVKHKIGKKLPQAQNATDTTIKSRSISLPEQSIATDKTGIAVTHRNLTLKDLLGQLKHYNERIRLDALHGLSELLIANPSEATRHACAIITALCEKTADPSAPCRTAMHQLLSKALFPALGQIALQPFVPLLMSSICAAMTHLAEPIRTDALCMLSIMMDYRADLVAQGYMKEVLQHFTAALSRSTRGRSLTAGSVAALYAVLSGLKAFLSKALAALQQHGDHTYHSTTGTSTTKTTKKTMTTSYSASGGVNTVEMDEFPLIASRALAWPPKLDMHQSETIDPGSTNTPSTNAATSELTTSQNHHFSSDTPGSNNNLLSLIQRLSFILLDCWRECSPSDLETKPEMIPLQCAAALLECLYLLIDHYGVYQVAMVNLAQDHQANNGDGVVARRGATSNSKNATTTTIASIVFDRIGSCFPFHEPAMQVSSAIKEKLIQTNVAAAQLLSLFLPYILSSNHARCLDAAEGMAASSPAWAERVVEWLIGVMRAQSGSAAAAALPQHRNRHSDTDTVVNSGDNDDDQKGDPVHKSKKRKKGKNAPSTLDARVYRSVLTTAKDILTLLPPNQRHETFKAALSVFSGNNPKSTACAAALEFFDAFVKYPSVVVPFSSNHNVALHPTTSAMATNAIHTVDGALDARPMMDVRSTLLYEEGDSVAELITRVPQHVWELGTALPERSAASLMILLDCARYLSPTRLVTKNNVSSGRSLDSSSEKLYEALVQAHRRMAPLFAVQLPVGKKKGKSNDNRKNRSEEKHEKTASGVHTVLGPIASMPLPVQQLAVDCLYHLPGLPGSTLKAIALVALHHSRQSTAETKSPLASAAGNGNADDKEPHGDEQSNYDDSIGDEQSNYDDSIALRMIHCAACKAEKALPQEYWGMLLALLLGPKKSSAVTQKISTTHVSRQPYYSWNRHAVVVRAACTAAFDAAPTIHEALAALAPPLLTRCNELLDIDTDSIETWTDAMALFPLYGYLSLFSSAVSIIATRKGSIVKLIRDHHADAEDSAATAGESPVFQQQEDTFDTHTRHLLRVVIRFVSLIEQCTSTKGIENTRKHQRERDGALGCRIDGIPSSQEAVEFAANIIAPSMCTSSELFGSTGGNVSKDKSIKDKESLLGRFLDVIIHGMETLGSDEVDARRHIRAPMLILKWLLEDGVRVDDAVWIGEKKRAYRVIEMCLSSLGECGNDGSLVGEVKILLNRKLGV